MCQVMIVLLLKCGQELTHALLSFLYYKKDAFK